MPDPATPPPQLDRFSTPDVGHANHLDNDSNRFIQQKSAMALRETAAELLLNGDQLRDLRREHQDFLTYASRTQIKFDTDGVMKQLESLWNEVIEDMRKTLYAAVDEVVGELRGALFESGPSGENDVEGRGGVRAAEGENDLDVDRDAKTSIPDETRDRKEEGTANSGRSVGKAATVPPTVVAGHEGPLLTPPATVPRNRFQNSMTTSGSGQRKEDVYQANASPSPSPRAPVAGMSDMDLDSLLQPLDDEMMDRNEELSTTRTTVTAATAAKPRARSVTMAAAESPNADNTRERLPSVSSSSSSIAASSPPPSSPQAPAAPMDRVVPGSGKGIRSGSGRIKGQDAKNRITSSFKLHPPPQPASLNNRIRARRRQQKGPLRPQDLEPGEYVFEIPSDIGMATKGLHVLRCSLANTKSRHGEDHEPLMRFRDEHPFKGAKLGTAHFLNPGAGHAKKPEAYIYKKFAVPVVGVNKPGPWYPRSGSPNEPQMPPQEGSMALSRSLSPNHDQQYNDDDQQTAGQEAPTSTITEKSKDADRDNNVEYQDPFDVEFPRRTSRPSASTAARESIVVGDMSDKAKGKQKQT